jgi:inorganic pyrophosphatase
MKLSSASSAIFFCVLIPSIMAVGTADDITIRTIGAPNTLDYAVYYGKLLSNASKSMQIPNPNLLLERNGGVISAFHDIPLFANEEKTLFNMVVEIPRWTNAKNEV